MLMDICEYIRPDAQEMIALYGSVGWTAYTDDPHLLMQGIRGSLLVLAAIEDNRLAGMIRVVGDGSTVVLVQDILVHPDYQRRGIGTALMKAVLDRFSHVRQIQLVTDDTEKTVAFYRSLGFACLEEIGCRGFMRCGKN